MTDEEILKAFTKQRTENIKKAVIRPKFRLYRELMQVAAFAAIIFLAAYFCRDLTMWQYISVLSLSIVLFFLTQTKNILFLLIFLYQRFAPRLIRGACLFTPSCSEYMRLSIEKYGVVKGVKKGFCRLRKCRPPNGGIDEP